MSKKKIFMIIASLVVVLSAVSLITYSIATTGTGNKTVIENDVNDVGLGGNYTYTSNIDLIIENSHKTPAETFNIVEIIPNGQTASDLSKYVAETINRGTVDAPNNTTYEYFKEYVIDANSDKSQTMASGKVLYDTVTVSATTALDAEVTSNIMGGKSTLQELLNSADLIYVSSQYYTSYDNTNNMSEEIYNFLHTYALGDNKPIIMDYVRPTDVQTATETLTFKSLTSLISNNHIRFRTFGWKADVSAEDFFKSKQSYYIKYQVDQMAAKGTVLVITDDSTDANSMYQKMLNYPGGAKELRKQAYYGQNIPEEGLDATGETSKYTVMSSTEVNALTDLTSLGSYDFILLEDSIMGKDITQDLYNKLRALSESGRYILYDSTSINSDESSEVAETANSYLKLMQLLISNKGVAKYSHVLPIANGFFTSLYSTATECANAEYAGEADKVTSLKEAAKEAAKSIADILSSGDYRGSLTDGSNGKKFRVLELQPCFPIDTVLASKQGNMTNAAIYQDNGVKGNYYKDPGSVLEGKSEDEVEDGTEYYKFELSKAKLVKALGEEFNITYDQIELDQMSTEAFISDKNVVLETYDLVYIGGNKTALTPNIYKTPFASGANGTAGSLYPMLLSSFMTGFQMYTHNGLLSSYYVGYGNIPVPYGATSDSGTTVQLNGNDLTLIKYNELKAYIDAGMPILFSSDVSDAFEDVFNMKNRLDQLANSEIDPDSRMYYLCKYAYEKKQADKNLDTIQWDVDITTETGETDYYYNKDRMFGSTLGSYVHLFSEDTNKLIKDAVAAGSERPSMKVVSKPVDYIQGNEKTYNENVDGTMSIVVALNNTMTTPCDFDLYVDENSNGTFTDEGERVAYVEGVTYTEGANQTLTYEFPYDDFYGLVSWKVIVSTEAASGGKICDVKTGYAYFKRNEDTDEKEVKVLQIMPVNRATQPGDNYGDQDDNHTLYLCTECQQAKYLATYNITTNGDFYKNTSGVYLKMGNVPNMGLHEHKFGIVKYDTAAVPISEHDVMGNGSEDWDYNFADEVEEDYNFDVDILLYDDYVQYTKIIHDSYVTDTTGAVTPKEISVDPFTNEAITPISADLYFSSMVDFYEGQWEEAKIKLERSGTEQALIEFLREEVEPGAPYNVGGYKELTKADIENWIAHRAFYRYFFFFGYYPQAGSKEAEYTELYNAWVTYNDEVVTAHQNYNKYACVQYSSNDWLYKNYDMVVLGFADNFDNKDLNLDQCNDLKAYLSQGGQVLLTHDTTTRYKYSGAKTLTTELRSTFGLDRYHVAYTNGVWAEDSSAEQTPVTSLNGYTDQTAIFIRLDNGNGNVYYGPFVLKDKNVKVKIVLDQDVKKYSNDQFSYDVASVYSVETTTDVTGSTYTIECEVYDTEQKLLDGELSTFSGAVAVGHGTFYNSQIAAPEWFAGVTGVATNGSVTLKPSTLTSGTINVNNALIYRKYLPDGYTTVASQNYVDPTVSKYYFTEMSVLGSDFKSRALFDYYVRKVSTNNNVYTVGTIAPIGVSDTAALFDTDWMNSSPYTYAEYDFWNIASGYSRGVGTEEVNGTIRASQVNEGIVTVYPFKISSELRISSTHAQQYALDLEDSNAAVWYTLSGCSGAKERSSLFAASPYDGLDSYFLYSYQCGKGTVNYCGAGHAVVTGPGKNNNDERRLYLNLILNSVRNKGSKPKITVHESGKSDVNLKPVEDGESPSTNPYVDASGNYVYSVTNKGEIPEFDYKVKANSQTSIAEMYVFYDLNYGVEYDGVKADYSAKYRADNAHKMIYHYTTANDQLDKDAKKIKNAVDKDGNEQKNIIIGSLKKDLYTTTDSATNETIDLLQLKPEYFNAYGGTYTYMVIWVKDADGKTSYKRIKINLIPNLFDLTDNSSYECPDYYFSKISTYIDLTERTKFNI